jgi:hypothetical protein
MPAVVIDDIFSFLIIHQAMYMPPNDDPSRDNSVVNATGMERARHASGEDENDEVVYLDPPNPNCDSGRDSVDDGQMYDTSFFNDNMGCAKDFASSSIGRPARTISSDGRENQSKYCYEEIQRFPPLAV